MSRLAVLVSAAVLLAACTPATVVRAPEVAPGLAIHAQAGIGAAHGDEDHWYWFCRDPESCALTNPGVNGEVALTYGFRPAAARPWSAGIVANSFRWQMEGYVQVVGGEEGDGGIGARIGVPTPATNREQLYQVFFLYAPHTPEHHRLRIVLNPAVSYRHLPLGPARPAMTALMVSPSLATELRTGPVRWLSAVSLSHVTGASPRLGGEAGEGEPFSSVVPMVSVGITLRGR